MDIQHHGTYPSSMPLSLQHQLHKERLVRLRAIPAKPEPQKYRDITDLILSATCEKFRVSDSDILSERRHGRIVKARHAAIVMFHYFTTWTQFRIAEKVNRDSSVVFYVLNKQQFRPTDYSDLERKIEERLHLIKEVA